MRLVLEKKIIGAIGALSVRQLLVQALNLGGMTMLARFLSLEDYGSLAVAMLVSNSISIFADAGIGASFIRQPKDPSIFDFQVLFTVQQALTATLCLLTSVFAFFAIIYFKLSSAYLLLFLAIGISIFTTSFQTVPLIQLERSLDFSKLAFMEVVQASFFNFTMILCLFANFGIVSFGIGVLSKNISGALCAYILNPWSIKWNYHLKKILPHLNFSIPFQLSNVLALANSSFNPIFVTAVTGLATSGAIAWSSGVVGGVQQPLFLLNRILFPVFSKNQKDADHLQQLVNSTYALTAFIHFGIISIIIGLEGDFVSFIFGEKWLPFSSLLNSLLIASIFSSFSVPNGALGNALGYSRTILILNIVKTTIFFSLLLSFFSFNPGVMSYFYAHFISEFVHFILYFFLKKTYVNLNLVRSQYIQFFSALFTIYIGISLDSIFLPVKTLLLLSIYGLTSLFFAKALRNLDKKNAFILVVKQIMKPSENL